MPFLLVPHEVTETTATIRVGAIGENVRTKSVRLDFDSEGAGGLVELDATKWHPWRSRRPLDRRLLNRVPFNRLQQTRPTKRFYYQRLTLGLRKPLKPRTSYYLRLHIDGHAIGLKDRLAARFTTLPAKLPSEEERPFTLFLDRCTE
jgi:hypothetical protein